MSDFNFYENSFCVSRASEAVAGKIASDLLLVGDINKVQEALIAQMHRHPEIASLVCCAGFNYLRDLALPPQELELLGTVEGN